MLAIEGTKVNDGDTKTKGIFTQGEERDIGPE